KLKRAASLKAAAIALLALTAPVWVAACGGGGGGGGSPPPPPPPPGGTGPTWTPGVFPSASGFKNRCAVVRTGTDIEGNTFPDVQGTALDERFWLRSWTHETY